MADEPTLGEVARRLEAVHLDLKEDVREIGSRLDKKVSVERYELERRGADGVHHQIIERVAAIEQARQQEARERQAAEQRAADRRAADRRLLFTAIIAPVLMLLLTLYLNTRGAGS